MLVKSTATAGASFGSVVTSCLADVTSSEVMSLLHLLYTFAEGAKQLLFIAARPVACRLFNASIDTSKRSGQLVLKQVCGLFETFGALKHVHRHCG